MRGWGRTRKQGEEQQGCKKDGERKEIKGKKVREAGTRRKGRGKGRTRRGYVDIDSSTGEFQPHCLSKQKQSMHSQTCLAIQDRLTHVQAWFTWNHSPLQTSKLSFVFVLLPPRSAATILPPRGTPRHHRKLLNPLLTFFNMFKTAAGYHTR